MKKTTCLLLLGAVLLSASSCKKIIEQEPENTIYREGFWKTENDAVGGISGTYASLRNVLNEGNRHYYHGEIPAETFASFAGDTFLPNVANGKYPESYQDAFLNWRPFYKVSANANLVIEQVANIPAEAFTEGEAGKQSIIGEALFIRALTYFYLTKIWGDCVYVTTVEADAQTEPNLPKTKQEDVLNGCIEDLKLAVEKLQFGYASPTNRAVRANKGSAYALMAHIYAWQKDYENAEKAANEAITKGGYTLLPIEQTVTMFEGKSTESIFEIEFSSDRQEGNAGGFAGKLLVDPYIPGKTNAWYVNQELLFDMFDMDTTAANPDKRWALWFERYAGNVICKKFQNVEYRDPSNPDTRRFDDNIVLFRLSDIMLLRAEALAARGRYAEARPLLAAVRTRAGLPDVNFPDAEMMDEIFRERHRELFMEGHAYWDRLRIDFPKHLPSHLNAQEVAEGAHVWPIHKDIFKDNAVLVQNAYWISRY
ncbi:MAG: RagB/SusD family nutrient uptake outer membrane protein [Chitinophagaceae bacterium]